MKHLFRALFVIIALAVAIVAHPLGNFSINQYSRLEVEAAGIGIRHVLDIAEIQTIQLCPEIVTVKDGTMQRVGTLSADLLLCDSGSKVLAVVDVRSAAETDRARKRHDRLARVLKAAGIKVYTWREDEVPTMSQVRALVCAELERQAGIVRPAPIKEPTGSRPMLTPLPEIEEVLAAGDQASYDAGMDTVPSGFYADQLDAAQPARR